MKPAIHIDRLSKLYHIGARHAPRYRTLRETIVESVTSPWRRLRELSRTDPADGADSFWALQDISFDVERGEVIGVIGPNGAGKSTLLRIISRITEPTSGRIEMRGRVASLLEIGTGFHWELTGRENIFLNGAILGMSRREMARRFDEIVAFADIGDFLDTPVKRYSSGMHVRLAFAVACHLEPEILLIDEVLAVGDQAFQNKCLGKLDEVSRSGRTILFVSHNMAAVSNLCQRAAVLSRGKLDYLGSCKGAVDHYLQEHCAPGACEADLSTHPGRRQGSRPILKRMRLLNAEGRATGEFQCGEPASLELLIQPDRPIAQLHVGIMIEDALRARLFTVSTLLSDCGPLLINGLQRVTCRIDQLPLAPGKYCASVTASPPREPPCDAIDRAAWFDVTAADFYHNGRAPSSEQGPFVMRSKWTVSAEQSV